VLLVLLLGLVLLLLPRPPFLLTRGGAVRMILVGATQTHYKRSKQMHQHRFRTEIGRLRKSEAVKASS
jgi:hypothetical protein